MIKYRGIIDASHNGPGMTRPLGKMGSKG